MYGVAANSSKRIYSDQFPQDVKERFLRRIDRTGECWLWLGAKGSFGYGLFKYKGVMHRAARMAFALHYGEAPAKLFICHHCDNPPCVRPDHLFTGTNAENKQDAAKKGRLSYPRQRCPEAAKRKIRLSLAGRTRPDLAGENNGSAKLTAGQVRKIFRELEVGERGTRARLALKYGVSYGAIDLIARGKNWSSLKGAPIQSTPFVRR